MFSKFGSPALWIDAAWPCSSHPPPGWLADMPLSLSEPFSQLSASRPRTSILLSSHTPHIISSLSCIARRWVPQGRIWHAVFGRYGRLEAVRQISFLVTGRLFTTRSFAIAPHCTFMPWTLAQSLLTGIQASACASNKDNSALQSTAIDDREVQTKGLRSTELPGRTGSAERTALEMGGDAAGGFQLWRLVKSHTFSENYVLVVF